MQKLLGVATAAAAMIAIPASATVVIETASHDVSIARGAASTAAPSPAPSPSSIPAVDPFALAIPVLLLAIVLLRGGRTRAPRPVIA